MDGQRVRVDADQPSRGLKKNSFTAETQRRGEQQVLILLFSAPLCLCGKAVGFPSFARYRCSSSYFATRAPVSDAIAASVVCAAFSPSRKSLSLNVDMTSMG